jgi:hypothetical protein
MKSPDLDERTAASLRRRLLAAPAELRATAEADRRTPDLETDEAPQEAIYALLRACSDARTAVFGRLSDSGLNDDYRPAERLAEPHAGPTLVVTHHVPHSAARHPAFGENALSPPFCSDCDDLIAAAAAAQAAGWIFGHHHWSHQVDIGGVRLLSAQPGYPGERTGWRGPGVLEI